MQNGVTTSQETNLKMIRKVMKIESFKHINAKKSKPKAKNWMFPKAK